MLQGVCSLDANCGVRQIYAQSRPSRSRWFPRSGTLGWIAGLYFMRINPVEDCMKDWHKPEVVEQDVGMEVTSYLPAELDA
jgi:coenzyme PQQ precursor peptide PqqA